MGGVAKTLGLVPKIPTAAQPKATEMPTTDPTFLIEAARKKLATKAQTGREGTRLSDAGTQSYGGDLLGS